MQENGQSTETDWWDGDARRLLADRQRLNIARFTQLREQSGLSVREVAKRAGIHHSGLARAASGTGQTLTARTKMRLLAVFPYNDLFEAVPDDDDLMASA